MVEGTKTVEKCGSGGVVAVVAEDGKIKMLSKSEKN